MPKLFLIGIFVFAILFVMRYMFCPVIFLFSFFSKGQDIPAVKIGDLVQRMDSLKEKTVVVNFWASFCKPCLEELPGFVRASAYYKDGSVKFMYVSLDFKEDYPQKILKMARTKEILGSTVWLDETNAEIFCPVIDPDWSGAIPATLIFNKQTGYRYFTEESLDEDTLKKEISKSLN